jgi:hypothetical protein
LPIYLYRLNLGWLLGHRFLIASRRPKNPIGWICLVAGIAWMLGMVSGSYALYGLRMAKPGSAPYPAAVGSLAEFYHRRPYC